MEVTVLASILTTEHVGHADRNTVEDKDRTLFISGEPFKENSLTLLTPLGRDLPRLPAIRNSYNANLWGQTL